MHQILPGATPGSRQYCIQAHGRRLAKADFNESQHLARLLFADGSEQVLELPIREPVVAKISSKKDMITLRWDDDIGVSSSAETNASVGVPIEPDAMRATNSINIPRVATDQLKNTCCETGMDRTSNVESIPLQIVAAKSIPPLEKLPGRTTVADADDSIPPLEEVPRGTTRTVIEAKTVETADDSIPPLEEVPRGTTRTVLEAKTVETADDSIPPLEEVPRGKTQIVSEAKTVETADDSIPPLEEIPRGKTRTVLEAKPVETADDSIPPLEEVPRRIPTVSETKNTEVINVPEDCLNPAAEELFLRMEASRLKKKEDAKKKEAVVAAKVNESSFGMKKGFFASSSNSKPKSNVIEVAPKKPNVKPLQLKEVQDARESWVQRDTSWVTPDLMKAVQMKPNILSGMENPRIQKALEIMGKDPEAAKTAYKDDPEVLGFLKEFASLMSTHFDVIGKEASATSSTELQPAAPPVDEELAGILQDPEMQELIQTLRTQAVDINSLLARKPHLVPKVKILIDRKLFNVASVEP